MVQRMDQSAKKEAEISVLLVVANNNTTKYQSAAVRRERGLSLFAVLLPNLPCRGPSGPQNGAVLVRFFGPNQRATRHSIRLEGEAPRELGRWFLQERCDDIGWGELRA